MNRRVFATLGVFAVPAAVSLGLAHAVHAQPLGAGSNAESSTPRTLWGHPDLQGVWASDSATPLERPTVLADREFLTDEEVARLRQRAADVFAGGGDAAFGDSIYETVLSDADEYTPTLFDTETGNYNQFWLIDRWFENRTSLIVDPPNGRMLPRTTEARRRRASLGVPAELGGGPPPAGPEDLGAGLRCMGGRLPMLGRGYNSNYQIVQSPGHVAILMEMMHETRIIPLGGRPHRPSTVRGALGDSRGHWEGDALVVETTNLTDGAGIGGGFGVSTSESTRLTERFTRVDAETLRYEFTMDDPTVWTQPWTAVIFMKPAPGTGLMYEFACHEGNYAIGNTLRGARAQEAETK